MSAIPGHSTVRHTLFCIDYRMFFWLCNSCLFIYFCCRP